jgi:hypothetical protein
MQVLKQLWNHIVNFFSGLSRPILFLGTCAVFLSFIISSQITDSVKKLKYLGEMVKQERLILELEQNIIWQHGVMIKQIEIVNQQEQSLEFYKAVINDLVRQLKEKLQKEQKEKPNRSEATSHERKTKYKNT